MYFTCVIYIPNWFDYFAMHMDLHVVYDVMLIILVFGSIFYIHMDVFTCLFMHTCTTIFSSFHSTTHSIGLLPIRFILFRSYFGSIFPYALPKNREESDQSRCLVL